MSPIMLSRIVQIHEEYELFVRSILKKEMSSSGQSETCTECRGHGSVIDQPCTKCSALVRLSMRKNSKSRFLPEWKRAWYCELLGKVSRLRSRKGLQATSLCESSAWSTRSGRSQARRSHSSFRCCAGDLIARPDAATPCNRSRAPRHSARYSLETERTRTAKVLNEPGRFAGAHRGKDPRASTVEEKDLYQRLRHFRVLLLPSPSIDAIRRPDPP